MPDWIEQPGLILFVEHYEACVAFYRDVLELEIFADRGNLTVFRFGGAYLMVEDQGVASTTEKTRAQNAVTLRLNVADVDATATRLRSRGLTVTVEAFDWGTIGTFLDPDGNRVQLRNHFDGFFAPMRT